MIIILGTDVHGGETVFNGGENMNDIGKREHVLKHSHGRCVIGYFDQILHEPASGVCARRSSPNWALV